MRRLPGILLLTGATLVVIVALLVSGLRLVLPHLDSWRPQLLAKIESTTGVPVDGHNLTWLCRQAKKYDRGFHQWFDESADLNQCYIETRYPADIEREYTYKMVKNFYRMAKEMYQYIFAEIDKEFDRREKAEEDAPFYAR